MDHIALTFMNMSRKYSLNECIRAIEYDKQKGFPQTTCFNLKPYEIQKLQEKFSNVTNNDCTTIITH